jgi:hypothetical protein
VLCSRCSEQVRPVVAIDIDGTLADYHGHLAEFADAWIGPSARYMVDQYDGSEPYWEWFCRAFGVDRTTFRQIKLAYRQGGMKRTMPPLADGGMTPAVFVGALRAHAEVWLTTTRPHDRFDRIDPDTREWLRRQGIEFDTLVYDDNKMQVLAENVDQRRVVAVLDDQEDVLIEAGRMGFHPILRRNDYNKGVAWPNAVNNLREALSVLTVKIEEWYR